MLCKPFLIGSRADHMTSPLNSTHPMSSFGVHTENSDHRLAKKLNQMCFKNMSKNV